LNVSLAQTIREMDNLMAYIEGINDERDLVPILLAVRERWPVLRRALMQISGRCVAAGGGWMKQALVSSTEPRRREAAGEG
jgi:hypothetical protein